ncbi:Neurotransmitter-gated ion-channel ligand-binding domain-containing protein [Strongyloides ratti]|uniref:Neurotransmitter-gated ion-channel ligand-binding domain-containing protein n=1 Tax=Strongyloides ratti TaxID=34506 RepID=A0A090KY12_STRRB|nr:Neurotransmitter-gated ion-channel ligand-binding domain-containing protein [Strongyloides ratti]CEF60113.1 Neurotransmitter-gated ion-channel ligand-binding domain-containing protein [Strongyloides ratti]
MSISQTFSSIFIILYLTIGVAISQYDYDCRWRKNVTDISEIAHHKYQILEDCIYYKLSSDANKMQGRGNSIMTLPPTVQAGEHLELDILNVGFRQIWMNELWKTMAISGYINFSWKDRRFKWDKSDFVTDEINIKSSSRIWIPDITTDKSVYSAQNSDFTFFKNIKARNTGNITTRMEYKVEADCNTDYSDFPDDKKQCCFNFRSSIYPTYIKYYLYNDHIDLNELRSNWHVQQSHIHINSDLNDPKKQYINICMNVKRRAPILRVELVLPMVISGLITILAPFFGKLEIQLYVKLFALLLHLMSFQFLSEKTPQLGFGETVPNLYVFYVFTFAITFVSIFLTLITTALNRVPRHLPPSHGLTLWANLCNSLLFCSAESVSSNDTEKGTKDYTGNWCQIYIALNNCFSIIVLIVYIVGIVILSF